MKRYIVRYQMTAQMARTTGLKMCNSKKEFAREGAAKKFAADMRDSDYTVSLHAFVTGDAYVGETEVVF